MPEDCVFCTIGKNGSPAEILLQNQSVYVIRDINPQAPIHLLIIPFQHLRSVDDLDETNIEILSHMTGTAKKAAESAGIHRRGYRLIVNNGPQGGQTISHLHMHLLGGRQLENIMG